MVQNTYIFNHVLILSQVEEDRVLLFLSKKQNKSWYPELDNGLETAEDEEPTEAPTY